MTRRPIRSGSDLAPSLSGGGPRLPPFRRRSRAAAMFISDCRREFYDVIVSQVRAAGRDRGGGGVTSGVPAAGGAVSPRAAPRGAAAVPAASWSGDGAGASPAQSAAAEVLWSSWGRGPCGKRGCPRRCQANVTPRAALRTAGQPVSPERKNIFPAPVYGCGNPSQSCCQRDEVSPEVLLTVRLLSRECSACSCGSFVVKQRHL